MKSTVITEDGFELKVKSLAAGLVGIDFGTIFKVAVDVVNIKLYSNDDTTTIIIRYDEWFEIQKLVNDEIEIQKQTSAALDHMRDAH